MNPGAGVASERRAAVRRKPQPAEPIARVRMRTGQELTAVNLSNTGALAEGVSRLLPGTRVDVHVQTRGGRVLIRARVLRAEVAALAANRVLYRGALQFDAPVDTS